MATHSLLVTRFYGDGLRTLNLGDGDWKNARKHTVQYGTVGMSSKQEILTVPPGTVQYGTGTYFRVRFYSTYGRYGTGRYGTGRYGHNTWYRRYRYSTGTGCNDTGTVRTWYGTVVYFRLCTVGVYRYRYVCTKFLLALPAHCSKQVIVGTVPVP